MYQYPENPPKETLDNTLPVFRAENRLANGYTAPSHSTIKNVEPNITTDGAYQIPGTQLFAVADKWYEAPQPVDIIHRAIGQPVLENLLIYRSGLQTVRQDTPNYRIFAQSVTARGNLNSATFNGDRSDIYGS